jgi:precorrin-2 dehydrogenase / sirohydrochlorin ferrochelatase
VTVAPAAGEGIPLLVRLAGSRVVAVGGGRVAASKVLTFTELGADLVVVAPTVVPDLRAAAHDGRLVWHGRAYEPGDLAGAVLAVAGTDDPAVNARVAADAAARNTLCVRLDDGDAGTAAFMGTVRRGPLLLGVSTQGAAPALARRMRADLADRYGPEWGELATLLGELRRDPDVVRALRALPVQERTRRWRAVLDTDILAEIREGRSSHAKELALSCLSSSSV